MEPLFTISSTYYEQPEFIQLHELANRQQERAVTTLWVRSLACAARLQADGIIALSLDVPLTPHDFATWLILDRTTRVLPLLTLLNKCDLIKKMADGHYHICHWAQHVVSPEIAANYHGLAKFNFETPNQTAASASVNTKQEQPTSITPLSLQPYTPEQRQRLAASTQKILAYLQQQSGKEFTATTETQLLLAELFRQKVTMKQIKQVINWKIKDWQGGDYWKFIRPQTLFGPKFNQYLLEAPPAPHVKSAKAQTRTDYLKTLFNVCSGNIDLAIRRAADDAVNTDRAEMEVIGHALGH